MLSGPDPPQSPDPQREQRQSSVCSQLGLVDRRLAKSTDAPPCMENEDISTAQVTEPAIN